MENEEIREVHELGGKHSEILTFAVRPYEEHFVDSFSLKSRKGNFYLVMNMGLEDYRDFVETYNIKRIRVLALQGGHCYIVDGRVPHKYFR